MFNLLTTPARVAGIVFAAGTLVAASAAVARPGTLNYAEGAVSINGRAVNARAIGQTEVAPGQVLTTENGRAEMLLTPGVLLRLGNNSSARMVSASLTDTKVEVLKGEALVEADQVLDANRIAVADHGVDTLLEKKGIYRFDADRPQVAVFDGKAKVLVNDQGVDVKKGKELPLDGAAIKPQKFDRDATDSLYQWSKVRSQYLADANATSARYIVTENPGWYAGTGWYWNPWYSSWAFVPAYGYGYSPFGFGFYSPGYWGGYYGGPVLVRPYGGFHGGFHSGGFTRPSGGGFTRPSGGFTRPSGGGFNRGGGAVHLGRGARM